MLNIQKIKNLLFIIILVSILTLPYFTFAGTTNTLKVLETVGEGGKYKTQNVTGDTAFEIIGIVVGVLLGFLGVIFVILTIYAGYNWMTARGNEEQVTKAKDTLKNAIIGLILVISAYAIWMSIAFFIIGEA